MPWIEIDADTLRFLEREAQTSEQSNPVLRRLLLETGNPNEPGSGAFTSSDSQGRRRRSVQRPGVRTAPNDVREFMEAVLEEEFRPGFQILAPFRNLYVHADRRVYVQNFNEAGAEGLCYSILASALHILHKSPRHSYVLLTNPAEGSAYILRFSQILERMEAVEWGRDDLEVKIDVSEHFWRELRWRMSDHFRVFDDG